MKTVRLTAEAAKSLRRHGNQRERIVAALQRYAETGYGDVKALVGSDALRLRVGDYRVIFSDDGTTVLVTKIAPRGEVYR